MTRSSHLHHVDAKRTSKEKLTKMVGHADHYKHPTEKAEDLASTAYYENENLDPLTVPTREKVGP